MQTGVRFAFAPFELDPARRRLTASGEPVAISDRLFDILLALASREGHTLTKDELVQAAWSDVSVSDNSVEQAISSLRRMLGTPPAGGIYIETVPRRGYRFAAAVTRTALRASDATLEALLAPHRAFVEGRAALETLDGDRVVEARRVFEDAVRAAPDLAAARVGLANACVMHFETTRADAAPDTAALRAAVEHAREACRLDPQSGEAWATLGFVLDRTGQRLDAGAAARRAVTLEPDNWRHHFRLAFVRWGDERLTAAHRTLALLPGFPLAHWLAATVYVARHALDAAERELEAGIAGMGAGDGSSVRLKPEASATRFSGVALHWLLGLIHLARGDEKRALEEFTAELSSEHSGHLYARECAVNTRYAIGALKMRQGLADGARASFGRVKTNTGDPLRRAAELTVAGDHAGAARLVEETLSTAEPGNTCWLLPVEPLINVDARPDIWEQALVRLRNRAS